jgi:hypothetical protein
MSSPKRVHKRMDFKLHGKRDGEVMRKTPCGLDSWSVKTSTKWEEVTCKNCLSWREANEAITEYWLP